MEIIFAVNLILRKLILRLKPNSQTPQNFLNRKIFRFYSKLQNLLEIVINLMCGRTRSIKRIAIRLQQKFAAPDDPYKIMVLINRTC